MLVPVACPGRKADEATAQSKGSSREIALEVPRKPASWVAASAATFHLPRTVALAAEDAAKSKFELSTSQGLKPTTFLRLMSELKLRPTRIRIRDSSWISAGR